MTLQLEVGKRYVRRNGLVTEPIYATGDTGYPYSCGKKTYTSHGSYCRYCPSDFDIIKEYTMSSNQSPDISPQIAKLEADLAELKRQHNAPKEKARRWYTNREMCRLVPTHARFLSRKISDGRLATAIIFIGDNNTNFSFQTGCGHSVSSVNFTEYEKSLDGGVTWGKFGVEE